MEKCAKYKDYIDFIFILASCIELALGILKECDYEVPGARFILWSILLVYALMMCCNRYTKKEMVIFAISLCIGGALYVSSGINTGIKVPIYIFALKGVDVTKLFKWMAVTLAIVITCVVFGNILFGIGTRYITDVRSTRGFDGKRYSLGFGNPNRLQIVMFGMMVYVMWMWEDRINIVMRIALGLIYFTTYILTDSITGLLVGGFVFVMFWVLKYVRSDKWCSFLAIGVVASIVVFLLISVCAASGVKNLIMQNINTFISERMNQLVICNTNETCLTGEIYNWSLFATRLHKNVYDLGYVQVFYYYGIIPALYYLIFIVYSVHCAWKKRNKAGILVIWGFAIYLFMEAAYFSNYLQRDFLLMAAACVVMGDRLEDKKKTVPV